MNLSDKIWLTRKTRIYTEKRLRKYAFLSEIFVVIYSLLMVFLSIWNLINSNQNISFFLVCGAIALLAGSIFITSQRYIERANTLRNCYIRLDELYFKVKYCENEQNLQQLNEYYTNYNDILLNVENHSEYDFLCLRYSLRNNKNTTLEPYTIFDLIFFIFSTAKQIMFLLLLFLLPFLLLIIWKLLS